MLGRYTTGPCGEARSVAGRPPADASGYPPAMPDLIDLRSDTVTRPTPEMRRAMAEAEVGDDVFGDDPTVQRARGARRRADWARRPACSWPAARWATWWRSWRTCRGAARSSPRPSRTRCWTRPPAMRSSSARRSRPLPARDDGTMDPDAIRDAFRDPTDVHEPMTSLVDAREHPRALDGPAARRRLHRVGRRRSAHERGVPLHVDGARLFNAAVALGTSAARAARRAPTRRPSACRRASPARSGPSSWAAATSSGARGGRASCSAAACARSACSRRPG